MQNKNMDKFRSFADMLEVDATPQLEEVQQSG